MIYKVIGIMSGSSLDGLDIAYCSLEENGGNWSYTIENAICVPFDTILYTQLNTITNLTVPEFMQLHTHFGRWIGLQLNNFIAQFELEHKVHLIASHGHTAYHFPANATTVQIGCGAAIAATTNLPVVNDLRAMDMAFGGQGAPIVPICEQLLFKNYNAFINIGGISNITINNGEIITAFDVCAANRILNVLANELGQPFDDEGELASAGTINQNLLQALNNLPYYTKPSPKSLGNEFGLQTVIPLIKQFNDSTINNLATYTEHIIFQLTQAINTNKVTGKVLVTGGGAFNKFLIESLQNQCRQIVVEVPDALTINYKESLAMAIMGALRWREENNTIKTATGARQASVGGALWMVNN